MKTKDRDLGASRRRDKSAAKITRKKASSTKDSPERLPSAFDAGFGRASSARRTTERSAVWIPGQELPLASRPRPTFYREETGSCDGLYEYVF